MRNESNVKLKCQNARSLNITKNVNSFKQQNDDHENRKLLKSV